MDCVTGKTVKENNVAVKKGNQTWNKPVDYNNEVVLHITRIDKIMLGNKLNDKKIEKVTEKNQSLHSANTIPTAPDKLVSTNKNSPVDIQLSYNDAGGDPGLYIIMILTKPLNSKLTEVGNNITYAPAKDFVGNDQFTWKVNDGADNSELATIKITIIQ
jgi:hypothetical protein